MTLREFCGRPARYQAGKGILEACSGLAGLSMSLRQSQQALNMTLELNPVAGYSQGLGPSSLFLPPEHGGVRQSARVAPSEIPTSAPPSQVLTGLPSAPLFAVVFRRTHCRGLRPSSPPFATFSFFLLERFRPILPQYLRQRGET